jgi:hypothetical protein
LKGKTMTNPIEGRTSPQQAFRTCKPRIEAGEVTKPLREEFSGPNANAFAALANRGGAE